MISTMKMASKMKRNLNKNGHTVAVVRASPKHAEYRQKHHLPSMVVFHRRSSSIEGCLPSKVVFHRRSSSIKGCFPSKFVFRQRVSSIKGRLPSNVIFRQRSSSVKRRLPSKVSLRLHQGSCGILPKLPWWSWQILQGFIMFCSVLLGFVIYL